MDDQRLGAGLRAVRIRRGWRQRDLAAASSVSDATVSRIERGHLDGVQVRTLRDVARALDIRIELLARSRDGDLDRLINAKHAALSEAVVSWLRSLPGWTVRPEVSYAWFGERGVVDLLAWSEERSALLEVELKTAIVDTGELLATIDRRRRLGREIAEPLGWAPSSVSSLLVIAESAANRTRVRVLSSTFDAALPDRIPEVRHYLRQPAAALRGLIFFSNRRPGQAINAFATARRVRAVSGRAPVAHSTPGDGLNEESPNSVLR